MRMAARKSLGYPMGTPLRYYSFPLAQPSVLTSPSCSWDPSDSAQARFFSTPRLLVSRMRGFIKLWSTLSIAWIWTCERVYIPTLFSVGALRFALVRRTLVVHNSYHCIGAG